MQEQQKQLLEVRIEMKEGLKKLNRTNNSLWYQPTYDQSVFKLVLQSGDYLCSNTVPKVLSN